MAVSRVGGGELSLACSSITAKRRIPVLWFRCRLTCTATMASDTPTILAALKQTFARRLRSKLRARTGARPYALWSTPVAMGHVWQRRFYDFVGFTENKRV